jgi:hypothetical protein
VVEERAVAAIDLGKPARDCGRERVVARCALDDRPKPVVLG